MLGGYSHNFLEISTMTEKNKNEFIEIYTYNFFSLILKPLLVANINIIMQFLQCYIFIFICFKNTKTYYLLYQEWTYTVLVNLYL